MDMITPSSHDDNGPATKHERLRTRLLADLQAGRLRPGDGLPTEHELARQMRMSRSTVRQALSGLERIGLIRRVRGRGTFIHENAGQRLRNGVDLFALVIPETRTGYYPSLQRGFTQASAAGHNQVIVSDTGNDPYRQADAMMQLMDQRVAGVAIVPTTLAPTPAHQIRPLQESGIPVVFCHRRIEGVRAPLVTFCAMDVGRIAGRALAQRGHRRAAYFGSHRGGLGPIYEQGLREAMRESGGDLPEAFVKYGRTGNITAEYEAAVMQNLKELLDGKDRPTGILCGFDSDAELVYLLLERLGVRVPQDVSLIGFGGQWREGALTRRLVSVTVDEEQLGRHAVRLLEEMRRRDRPIDDMTEILMPLELSGGQTLGPVGSVRKPKGRS
jgi:DNA-binding LacI/PurR family transcriptional regulator